MLLIGDARVFEAGARIAGVPLGLVPVGPADDWTAAPHFAHDACDTIVPGAVTPAQVSQACGTSALRTLDRALALAQAGRIDAILFGPLNKAALHLAGLCHDDELHCMAGSWASPGMSPSSTPSTGCGPAASPATSPCAPWPARSPRRGSSKLWR